MMYQVSIPRANDVKRGELQAMWLHRWFSPLLSVASLANMTVDTVTGTCFVLFMDYTKWTIVSSDQILIVATVYAVVLGFQITATFDRYNMAQENFRVITCNDNGLPEDEVKEGLVSLIIKQPINKVMPAIEFQEKYASITSTVYTFNEKYKAYTLICNTVASQQNKPQHKLLWWFTHIICAIVVPLAVNDSSGNSDFGWLFVALVTQLFLWAIYGLDMLFSDVLRPVKLWIYDGFNTEPKAEKPRGFLQQVKVVF